jgi:hypothetical protein
MGPATADRITRIIACLASTSTRAIAGTAVGAGRAALALAATLTERLTYLWSSCSVAGGMLLFYDDVSSGSVLPVWFLDIP